MALIAATTELGQRFEKLELTIMLNAEEDTSPPSSRSRPAPAAPSRPWTGPSMLMRMYLAAGASGMNYQTELVDLSEGDQKPASSPPPSASSGPYAYGYLKGEMPASTASSAYRPTTPTPAATPPSPPIDVRPRGRRQRSRSTVGVQDKDWRHRQLPLLRQGRPEGQQDHLRRPPHPLSARGVVVSMPERALLAPEPRDGLGRSSAPGCTSSRLQKRQCRPTRSAKTQKMDSQLRQRRSAATSCYPYKMVNDHRMEPQAQRRRSRPRRQHRPPHREPPALAPRPRRNQEEGSRSVTRPPSPVTARPCGLDKLACA
jgi:hypothetical protein